MYATYDGWLEAIISWLKGIHSRVSESKKLLNNLSERLLATNHNIGEIYIKLDSHSSALLTEAKTISAQGGKNAAELRKLVTGRVALILAKLRELKETLLTLNSNVVKINENLVTTNDNMVHNYSKWTPWFYQQFQSVIYQSRMLEESEKSRHELLKAIDEFHRDIVEELQKSRAELIGGARIAP